MAKIYKQPFAHSGDAIAIPSASQSDGKMSSADGWTPDYQLLKTDPNYKPVGRQEMNGVFKEVTEALGQVQVQGAASWSADGAPYPVNAQVYHNGAQWIALRANSVAPTEGGDWTELVGKQYVDAADYLQPSMTGSATLNGTTDNTVQLTDIVTTLGLEAGDVIRIQYSGYDKLHSVESITSNDLIVVNYEHAGNRGNGSLKLADQTATVTIKRISKWFNAPIGLGQDWVDLTSVRANDTDHTNLTQRNIQVAVNLTATSSGGRTGSVFEIDAKVILSVNGSSGQVSHTSTCVVPVGSTYRRSLSTSEVYPAPQGWRELR